MLRKKWLRSQRWSVRKPLRSLLSRSQEMKSPRS
jgi:hypothetical protein